MDGSLAASLLPRFNIPVWHVIAVFDLPASRHGGRREGRIVAVLPGSRYEVWANRISAIAFHDTG